MAKVTLDLNELTKNIKASAQLAKEQINEFAKKAQKDLSNKEIAKHINKIIDTAKKTNVEVILSNPKIQKLIQNPRVQELLKNEKVQEFINNPKVKEVTSKITLRAKEVGAKVKKTTSQVRSKARARKAGSSQSTSSKKD